MADHFIGSAVERLPIFFRQPAATLPGDLDANRRITNRYRQ
jgi:hypothetical protein